MGITDTLRKAREKIERKTTQKKAEKRARGRRIEKGEPEGVFEGAVVAGKETKKLGSAAGELVKETTPDVDTEKKEKGKGILGGIGEGASSVIEDVESGELDEFGPSGGMDDDLDMDLDFDDDIP